MTPDTFFDVVVIGFGVAGATAALSAVDAGACVLALDQGVLDERELAAPGTTRSADALRARLRAAVLAGRVNVRAPCRVHELVTEGGRVCGVGYATLPSGGVVAAGHRWLRRMSDRAPGRAAALFARAAESVWRSRFLIGEVCCSSVVLAMDPGHWDFVGPAAWTAARAVLGGGSLPQSPPSRLHAVHVAGTAAVPTPELAARRWCASREAAAFPAAQLAELRVDEVTGAVLVNDGQLVPGLYSAVRMLPAGAADPDPGGVSGVARRAGYGASSRRHGALVPGLRAVL